MKTLACLLVLSAILITPRVCAQGSAAKPEVWMMPPGQENGRGFRELFQQPEAWKETRSLIHVLACSDLHTQKFFTDDELRTWFAQMNGWGLKFAMEVGAIKEWGPTGEKTFAAEQPIWERVERLGGKIYAVALDEPLVCCRQHLKKDDAYAVGETANYIALVREHFPNVLIGDIEPYPFLQREELLAFIDALQARLKQMNVRGLDFFRLDVDWNHFTIGNTIYAGNWPDVKKLELACRQRKLPFSLIYWAADYDRMKQLSLADDATWYVGIMQQGYDYAYVDGAPDQYVVESWVSAPARCLPETGDFTFTRSVRDFVKKFAQPRPPTP